MRYEVDYTAAVDWWIGYTYNVYGMWQIEYWFQDRWNPADGGTYYNLSDTIKMADEVYKKWRVTGTAN